METCMRSLVTTLIFLALLFFSAPAHGQEPDIREIRPAVMLILDTSGSMEYDVSAPSRLPVCLNNVNPRNTRSRWTALVEALTGTYGSNYFCSTVNRRIFRDAADQYYHLAHYQAYGTQATNGLLDTYLDRIKFGLMTMDSTYGIANTSGTLDYLIPSSIYTARIRDIIGAPGGYSYGDRQPVSWPGCGTSYVVNGGARRAAGSGEAILGGLISVGADSADYRVTNAEIQSTLLALRPYGGSTIDALLGDFQVWLEQDDDVRSGSDPLAACRSRYAILISDGEGDDLYRRFGCEASGSVCPYDRSSETVRELCAYNGTECTGLLDGFYAVSYASSSPAGRSFMNDLASVGGTGSAYEASNTAALLDSLSAALDRSATGTTTRTTTAYIGTSRVYRPGASTVGEQYEFTSGFRIGSPWTGILERTRYTCTGPRTPPTMEDLAPEDQFHELLNTRDLAIRPRDLITVVGADWNSSTGVIIGQYDPVYAIPTSPTRGSRRLTDENITRVLSTTEVTAAHLGFFTGSASTREASRTTTLNWLHSITRPGARMGDIYHSNPVISSPPVADIADESFNLWRQTESVIDRPPVIYVGTNDGILHAFAVENFSTLSGRNIRAGDELWGFVPPAILSRVESARNSHQFLLDGTPVIRNVFYRRRPGDVPSANSYHTVLVQGLRGGGPFYIAMDVSDPLDPKFLWQFTRPEMGPTIGRAGVGQVLVEIEGVLQERAVAVFGAGGGELVVTGSGPSRGWGSCSIPPGASRRGIVAYPGRSARRCWLNDQGRGLYVVDIATGEVIREFGADIITSPMVGSVSLYTGDTGTIANRAYTVDADGALWRLDMSSRDPDAWSLETIHDLYWADSALDGASSQEPPILSVDNEGQVVVIVGTGNIDDLEGQDLFRVVSVTDRITWSATGVASYAPVLNWEIRLKPGEQVTGPMELFMSRVYFSTFSSTSSATDACQWGGSKIWGVDYLRTGPHATGYDPVGTITSPFPLAALESTPNSGVFDRHFTDMSLNSIAMGVAIAATPTCVVGTTTMDPYLGSRFSVTEAGGGDFRLVSQLSGPRATRATGTAVSLYNLDLPQPPSYTRVLSWVGNADY